MAMAERGTGDRGVPRPVLRAAAAAIGAVAVLFAACSSPDPEARADGAENQASEDAPEADSALPAAVEEAIKGMRFTDVSAEAGLTQTHSDLGLYGEAAMTAGASVADVDSDGDLDVFLPRVGKPNGLYINDGSGQFTDVGESAGVGGPDDGQGASAGAFFDIEGDGDMDLFVTGTAMRANALYVNDGNGGFTEESAQRGLEWPAVANEELGSRHHGASVADVNGDGFLDLLVLQWYSDVYNGRAFEIASAQNGWQQGYAPSSCESAIAFRAAGFPVEPNAAPTRSALLLNDGTGSFTDATADFGLPLGGTVAFTGVFNDFDGDGWPDLAIAGDGCTSMLLRNVEGSRFEDVTFSAGVGTDENGMGAVAADVNGDGFADLFVTSISYALDEGEECPVTGFNGCSGNRLYLNDGNATFTDATDEFGLREGDWGWGAAIEDFDGDGTREVVQANGMQIREPGSNSEVEFRFTGAFEDDRTRFWVMADGAYHDVADAVGIEDDGISHAVVPFDMDGDGDLDLLIARSNDTPLLYRNDSDRGDNATLVVELVDPTSAGNRWGDAARVEVTPTAGSDPVVGWVGTSGSYESQRPPVLHLGRGGLDGPIEMVDVHWRGGAETQTLTEVAPGGKLTGTRAG